MQISLIIPNYNGRELLSENLPLVIKEAKGAEIIVVDDGSTDGSGDFIRRNFPQVKLIAINKNAGFSRAVNLGVGQAKAEIVVLLNHDVRPKPDFLKPLLLHFQAEKVFAVGCLDESQEGKRLVERGRGIGWFERGFLIHRRGQTNRKDTLWVSGGSGAFRKSLWQKLGGLDELYSPFYWEDIDLSYRALKAGYQLVFEPASRVIHQHQQGAIRRQFEPEYVKSVAYRNQIIFFWKNITDKALWLNHLIWLPYHLTKALLKWDRAFIKGFLMAVLALPQVLLKRKKLKKLFIVSDQEIVKGYKNEA